MTISDGFSENSPGKGPRLFVLSDTHILLEGIVLALSHDESIEVVGASNHSLHPLRIAGLNPDVLLIDFTISMDLRRSRALRVAMPEVKMVALGVVEAEADVVACAEAGIAGFVSSTGSLKDIASAIHSAVRGELVCSPQTAGMLFRLLGARKTRAPMGGDEMLTPREREIVLLMGEGLPNKHIARRLGIHDATVKNHVHSILSKLGVSRRGEVAAQLFQAASPPTALTQPNGGGGLLHR